MINEIAAIFIIIILVAVIFSKRWRPEYVKTAYGLAVLPGFYVLSYFLCFILKRSPNFRFKFYEIFSNVKLTPKLIMIGGIVMGLVVCCIILGLIMGKFKKKPLRIKYILINGFFVSGLTAIMLYNLPN